MNIWISDLCRFADFRMATLIFDKKLVSKNNNLAILMCSKISVQRHSIVSSQFVKRNCQCSVQPQSDDCWDRCYCYLRVNSSLCRPGQHWLIVCAHLSRQIIVYLLIHLNL